MKSTPYPVRVAANIPGTMVIMLHRRDLFRLFNSSDKERIYEMSTINFPTYEGVLRDIDVLKHV